MMDIQKKEEFGSSWLGSYNKFAILSKVVDNEMVTQMKIF